MSQRALAVAVSAVNAATGLPLRVLAVCTWLDKSLPWPLRTRMPNVCAPRSVAAYAAWFQLPYVQPARGPL